MLMLDSWSAKLTIIKITLERGHIKRFQGEIGYAFVFCYKWFGDFISLGRIGHHVNALQKAGLLMN